MFSVTVETKIERRREEVFSYISDAENDPDWCDSVKEIERITSEGPGPGAKYRMHHRPGGMKFDALVETTRFNPPERIDWLMTDSGHRLKITYELEEENGGSATRLRQTSRVQTRGWLRIPGFFMKGFIKKDMKKTMTEQFRKLKLILEEDK